MLNFLRKYQKIVFGAVTGALIISILFFGSYGAMMTPQTEEKDQILGNAMDGSPVSKLYIEKMMRFLSTDHSDQDVRFSGKIPNYFNSGVIREDFIETGFAKLLAIHYFDFIKKDLEERLEKQKSFRGYQHPAASFISAETLRNQMLPALARDVAQIKNKDFTITKENLDVLFHAYTESRHFSSDLLRQFLGYQQDRYDWIAKDPYLYQGDLSLFHFHDVEDWFGPTFHQMLCQAIHNMALYAKQQGFKVTEKEAKADLLKIGYESLTAHSSEPVTDELFNNAWKQVLASCRVSEKEAIRIWQEVLLCKKMLEEEKQSILVDHLCDADFANFGGEAREVAVYSLPAELQFKDFGSLMKFQVYLEAVAKNKKEASLIDLPKQFKTKEEIAMAHPELLVDSFDLLIKQVKASELGIHVSYKQLIDWQIAHQKELKVAFEQIALMKEQQDFIEVLDHLDDATRSKIDKYSLKQIIKENPELIAKSLEQASSEKKTLVTSILRDEVSLPGIIDPKEFFNLLTQTTESKIENFSQDQEHFYTIEVVSTSKEPELLSFKRAKELGVLEKMLDAKLQKHLQAAKSAQPSLFLNEKGEAKPFESVKEHIGAFYFKELLEKLDKLSAQETKQKNIYHHYADLRLLSFMQKAKEDIEKTGSHSPYLQKELFAHLEARDEKVKRSDKKEYVKESLFELSEGTFSPLITASRGDLCFYKVLSRLPSDPKEMASAIERKQKLLGEEARRKLMLELAKQMVEKESLHLEQAQR